MNLFESLSGLLNDNDQYSNLVHSKVKGLAFDSRSVKVGYAFFAITGFKQNGLDYVSSAINNGANSIVSEVKIKNLPTNVINYVVTDIRLALARAAKNFYYDPSSALQLFSVTGTNGKTSVAWIFAQMASLLDKKSMYIGTLGVYVFDNGQESLILEVDLTTPDSLLLNSMLALAVSNGIAIVSMEVTSVGLTQSRTSGINWNSSAFTNLTQDHLDYHETMEKYGEAKSRLFFEELKASNKLNKTSIINVDDEFGLKLSKKLKQETFSKVLRISTDLSNTVSSKQSAEFFIESITNLVGQISIKYNFIGEVFEVKSKLLGSFNISNLTVAIAGLFSFGFKPAELSNIVENVNPVPGRMEMVISADGRRAFVDYSHTPDSLKKAQICLRKILDEENSKGKLITVFGCGGDRDKTKRPIMAKEVESLSDFAIPTSDNPRTEDPQEILKDVVKGFSVEYKNFITEVDRSEAIRKGVQLLKKEDILLVAGKGHENYQEVNGIKNPFDDRDKVREFFKQEALDKK